MMRIKEYNKTSLQTRLSKDKEIKGMLQVKENYCFKE